MVSQGHLLPGFQKKHTISTASVFETTACDPLVDHESNVMTGIFWYDID